MSKNEQNNDDKQLSRSELLEQFSKIINITFKDIDLLDRALTHRSFINEHKHADHHNERLEFLGDAVLELIISEYLFSTYPDRPEGELTSFRAATVRTESLAAASRKLGVGEYLQMSKGEESTGGRDKDYLLANSFESILGAIYMDQGYESCTQFVGEFLIPQIAGIVENRLDIDPKTKFQELSQSLYQMTPTYTLVSDEGPDHDKVFTMAVYVGKKNFGEGKGNSKQRAEEQAADNGLKKISKDHPKVNIA